ncbi:hypothetical protein [Streptomyces sp. NPDC007088]|uniref:hypothetical protein n=1 Tax=Streptomyces sp. NPDC007088 TaxID=3364773 RepID=UPI0036CB3C41
MRIYFAPAPESTPTLRFSAAVNKISHTLKPAYDKWGTKLRVSALRTDLSDNGVSAERWYDLDWVIPAYCRHGGNGLSVNHNDTCSEISPYADTDIDVTGYPPQDAEGRPMFGPYGHHILKPNGKIGPLRAPRRRSDAELLAELPTAEEMYQEMGEEKATHWYGTRDRALDALETERRLSVRRNTRAEVYDWDELAHTLVDMANTLQPPKVTPAQRVEMAIARREAALEEVHNAEKSIYGLLNNVIKQDPSQHGTQQQWAQIANVSRPTLNSWANRW